MHLIRLAATGAIAGLALIGPGQALAANVKVTPLSGRTMEFDGGGVCVAGC